MTKAEITKDKRTVFAPASASAYLLNRPIDVCVAMLGLLLLSPLLALLAMLVWVSMGRPVFFRQWRVGLRAGSFKVWKLRTMTNDSDSRGEILPDEERLRPIGRWLRRSSMDELPQLVNVLLGQMSVVGPRALPVEHLATMDRKYMRRYDVKPGLTGWTQVLYRGRPRTWDEKYQLDLEYVNNKSLLLDIRIILMTVGVLVRRFRFNRRGVSIGDEGVT
jgi:sugar transferase EpsL